MTLLSDVADLVSRSHDLDETLGNVVDLVAKRLDADVCSVYLTHRSQTLDASATRGLPPSRRAGAPAFGGAWSALERRPRPVPTEDARSTAYRTSRRARSASARSSRRPLVTACDRVIAGRPSSRRVGPRSSSCALRRAIAPVVMNAQLRALVSSNKEAIADRLRLESAVCGAGRPRPIRTSRSRRSRPAGVAIGPSTLEDPLDLERVEYEPSPDAEQEHRDLLAALESARRELDDTRDEVGERFGPEFSAVFNTHIQILEDKGFVAKLENAVRESRNALRALRDVAAAYRRMFENIEDPFFRDRGIDVEDVTRRVMAQLLGVRHQNIPLSDGAILVTSHLLPAPRVFDTEKSRRSPRRRPTSHGPSSRSRSRPGRTARRVRGEPPGAASRSSTARRWLPARTGAPREYERAQQHYSSRWSTSTRSRRARETPRPPRGALRQRGLVADPALQRHGPRHRALRTSS